MFFMCLKVTELLEWIFIFTKFGTVSAIIKFFCSILLTRFWILGCLKWYQKLTFFLKNIIFICLLDLQDRRILSSLSFFLSLTRRERERETDETYSQIFHYGFTPQRPTLQKLDWVKVRSRKHSIAFHVSDRVPGLVPLCFLSGCASAGSWSAK